MPRKEDNPAVARQRFDIPRWIESNLAELNLKIAVSELIDNALDETLPSQKALITVTFDPRSSRVTFENRETPGMDIAKMKEFPLWGGLHKDPTKIKEHRLGGKLAILFLLSKDKGSLSVTSKLPNTRIIHKMEIPRWWENLSPEIAFPIQTLDAAEIDNLGTTRFELEGVRGELIPSNVVELADELGLIYGPLIQGQRLSIDLMRHLPRGGRLERKQVLPVTVPFDKKLSREKTQVPTGKSGKGPGIDIAWGLLDQEQKRREEQARRGIYETQRVTQIRGDSIYFYYHGRLLRVEPLSTLRIPGHTGKHILQSFAITVDVQKGWAPKTILKTSLSASATETQDILRKVVSLVSPDIALLVKDIGSEGVPERYVEKAKSASTALATVLNDIFDNNPRSIAETFGLPSQKGTVFPSSPSKERPKAPTKTTHHSLPGTKTTKTATGAGLKEAKQKTIWVNPIPEFRISPFPSNSPEAQISIDQETGKTIIELNYSNPAVSLAFQQTRGKVFIGEVLRIGAATLFHEKWSRLYPKDSTAYAKGVQDDVANLLSAATRLKVI
ncbi:MAG: hypothetical protein UX88_C0005G0028 [Candidatus Woesebacteria bacterium GW2011_GWC2_47_16]|uniref:Uncharacterized protein n=8 Tax=Candidatus Woeseibacteriota TaxID=1752722 RepID=A0A0G1TR80_9BACT|nr:MAG: hypothetical protein UX34_C0001G0028 [Candidatus Woesebacteria bacterium GW2011_GWF1_46_13]KKU47890.1 MAG: hypothetical protein UX67_C0027G0007 [Candidatus Woesebacteria bacterium GW2011_GWF2_46_8]KKU65218.1 MAG: hypothetical protein UX88_C0005G0028 [Candidatus Woesebacteria bacterium GW2011_GWC2_47_16]KKU71111.1 MAG: hypothetical protein UX95_C0004G0014 [Candidatus Woesebacteria bacterium GW2011_GWD1_47_21]OGM78013.1 MAG: hypothetical protein A2197_00550 [Candidatus Woesebacteria bacte